MQGLAAYSTHGWEHFLKIKQEKACNVNLKINTNTHILPQQEESAKNKTEENGTANSDAKLMQVL